MSLTWKNAVLLALQRYSARNSTVKVTREKFIKEEIKNIVANTESLGKTPSQTVSRVLQELRDEKVLFFSKNSGEYILNNIKINVGTEDFLEDILENAIVNEKLIFQDVETSSAVVASRIRIGMEALRKKTLSNYRNCCALCDIDDERLLVTSHIARWADNPSARGLLSNTICFCTLHDKLFENGYFSIRDDISLVWAIRQNASAINVWKNDCTKNFKLPIHKHPSPNFMRQHRIRVGL